MDRRRASTDATSSAPRASRSGSCEDTYLDAGTLTGGRAQQRQTSKGLVLVKPKSNAGKRTIKLPEPLRSP